LAEASTWETIERTVVEHVERVFRAGAMLLAPDAGGQLQGALPEKELSTAQWAFEHGQTAGRFTDTLPMAEAMYVPLRTTGGMLGLLRLHWRQTTPPTLDQRHLLEAFIRHIALVLDRLRLREASAQARIVAESERLGRSLLNSISHDCARPSPPSRTAAGALQAEAAPTIQAALSREIQEAAERLNRLVGNLLDMTRLESGRVKPKLDWCDVSDLINTATKRVTRSWRTGP